MMTSNVYQLKYIDSDGKIGRSSFAALPKILYRLDQLLEDGMYCIVVDANDDEYKPSLPSKPQQSVRPAIKPMRIDLIAAHMDKPENVEKRKQARLDDVSQWAKLRSN